MSCFLLWCTYVHTQAMLHHGYIEDKPFSYITQYVGKSLSYIAFIIKICCISETRFFLPNSFLSLFKEHIKTGT